MSVRDLITHWESLAHDSLVRSKAICERTEKLQQRQESSLGSTSSFSKKQEQYNSVGKDMGYSNICTCGYRLPFCSCGFYKFQSNSRRIS